MPTYVRYSLYIAFRIRVQRAPEYMSRKLMPLHTVRQRAAEMRHHHCSNNDNTVKHLMMNYETTVCFNWESEYTEPRRPAAENFECLRMRARTYSSDLDHRPSILSVYPSIHSDTHSA